MSPRCSPSASWRSRSWRRRPLDAGETAVDRLASLVRAALGPHQPVLPVFTLAAGAELAASTADRAALLGGDDTAPVTWLHRAGLVRAELDPLCGLLTHAEAGGADVVADLAVAQLPHRPGARWCELPFGAGGPPPAGTVGVVAHAPAGFDPTQPLAGLFVDAWAEVIPSAEHTAGVAFHYDAPGARPPQAILLAVHPDLEPDRWNLQYLLETLQETISLARLRTVTLRELDGLAGLIPALYLPNNYTRDVASVSFKGLVTAADAAESGRRPHRDPRQAMSERVRQSHRTQGDPVVAERVLGAKPAQFCDGFAPRSPGAVPGNPAGTGQVLLRVWLGAAARRRSVSPHMSSRTYVVTQTQERAPGRVAHRRGAAMTDPIWSLPVAQLDLELAALPSAVTWSRLEPLALTSDLTPGLQALLGDPLWLIGRQWQFGELQGEDAGTPISVIVEIEQAPLSRLRRGPSGEPIDLVDESVPLEARIEAEPVTVPAERVRARPACSCCGTSPGRAWARCAPGSSSGGASTGPRRRCWPVASPTPSRPRPTCARSPIPPAAR